MSFFFLKHTSAAEQAAKSRTKSIGDSQMIFALTLCFGELQEKEMKQLGGDLRPHKNVLTSTVHEFFQGVHHFIVETRWPDAVSLALPKHQCSEEAASQFH